MQSSRVNRFLNRFEQGAIFAEFSCEGYSCDSFISKAEVVSDRYSAWENYRELSKMSVDREFPQNVILAPKPDVGQMKIFAEFSCERYSCDSFNSKAEMVFDSYCLRENYRVLPEIIVEREFRQNRILAPLAGT